LQNIVILGMAQLESRPNGVRCPCGSKHTYYRKWLQIYHCRKCGADFIPKKEPSDSTLLTNIAQKD
jgi:DNA-directed RNA polymerase subunit RPC12/RpoP